MPLLPDGDRMKKHIPNLFTLGNLLCGCLAVLVLLESETLLAKTWFDPFLGAAFLVLLGAFLDFFDGFFARLLKVDGELGKQLDSLADMVTFGVVPGLIAYKFIIIMDQNAFDLCLIPLLIILMSAMRLAKFNISTEQTDSFIGVPTPANALFWIGLPFLLDWQEFENTYLVIGLALLFSYLLVCPLRLIALKFKTYGWSGNQARWVLILSSIATLITLTTITGNVLASLPIIIILYIIISVINNSFSKHGL